MSALVSLEIIEWVDVGQSECEREGQVKGACVERKSVKLFKATSGCLHERARPVLCASVRRRSQYECVGLSTERLLFLTAFHLL